MCDNAAGPEVLVYSIADPDAVDMPLCSCTRETWPAPVGQIVVLRVAGVLDLYTEAPLRTVLAAALTRRFVPVVVDLAGVSFCGGAGFGVLADTALQAFVTGRGFAVTGLSPTLQRHANLVWIADLPVRYRGVAQAVRALCTPSPPTRTHRARLPIGRSSQRRLEAGTDDACPDDAGVEDGPVLAARHRAGHQLSGGAPKPGHRRS